MANVANGFFITISTLRPILTIDEDILPPRIMCATISRRNVALFDLFPVFCANNRILPKVKSLIRASYNGLI